MKVFIHSQEHLKMIRRVKRDAIERGYDIEDVLYRFEHHVTPSFRKYIEPYSSTADIVVNNDQNFEKGLSVLTGFLRDKLHSY